MATRPEEYTTWASDETQVVEPAGGLKATGWSPGDAPPAQYFNWLFWLNDQWIQWLDQENEANTAEINHARLADAAARPFSTGNILSGSHNWFAGAVSNASGNDALVYPRYWVVGDDGAGNTAMAYGHAEVTGGSWADETGSAQTGTLTRCAAHETLCMGIGGTAWKLGGSTNSMGSSPGLVQISGIAYDAVNDLWVAAMDNGVYTSPPTVIAWTLRQAGDFRDVFHDRVTGRTYAIAYINTGSDLGGIFYSTNGTTWTAAPATFGTPAGEVDALKVCSEGLFVVDDGGGLYHTTDPDGGGFADITPAGPDPTGATVWSDVFTLPGMYFSYGAADDQWRGAYFTAGVGTVVCGGDHGAIGVAGGAGAWLFGPTIKLPLVPFAS